MLHVTVVHSFLLLCMYHNLFIYSPADGHLVCFQFLVNTDFLVKTDSFQTGYTSVILISNA